MMGAEAFDATSTPGGGGGKLTGEVMRRALGAGKHVGRPAPTAATVPAGVVVESGGGRWGAAELAQRAQRLVRQLVRLPLE